MCDFRPIANFHHVEAGQVSCELSIRDVLSITLANLTQKIQTNEHDNKKR